MRAVAVLLVIVLIAAAVFSVYWFVVKGKSWDDFKALFQKPDTPPATGTIETGELSINFLELGNKYTGDCTLIKIGDTEVLIDAGSRKGSAETLIPAISEYCTDGMLEYVIATHADQDHIAAFVGTNEFPGVFESFECEVIIDFPKTNKNTAIYKDYLEERDKEVEAGAEHYTALECWN